MKDLQGKNISYLGISSKKDIEEENKSWEEYAELRKAVTQLGHDR